MVCDITSKLQVKQGIKAEVFSFIKKYSFSAFNIMFYIYWINQINIFCSVIVFKDNDFEVSSMLCMSDIFIQFCLATNNSNIMLKANKYWLKSRYLSDELMIE